MTLVITEEASEMVRPSSGTRGSVEPDGEKPCGGARPDGEELLHSEGDSVPGTGC